MKMTNREFYDTLIKIVYFYDRYQYKRNSYVGDKLFKDDAKVFYLYEWMWNEKYKRSPSRRCVENCQWMVGFRTWREQNR